MREMHTRGDAKVGVGGAPFLGAARQRVLAWFALLTQIGELAHRLHFLPKKMRFISERNKWFYA